MDPQKKIKRDRIVLIFGLAAILLACGLLGGLINLAKSIIFIAIALVLAGIGAVLYFYYARRG